MKVKNGPRLLIGAAIGTLGGSYLLAAGL